MIDSRINQRKMDNSRSNRPQLQTLEITVPPVPQQGPRDINPETTTGIAMRKEITQKMEKLSNHQSPSESIVNLDNISETNVSPETMFNRTVNTSCTIVIPREFKVLKDLAFAELTFNTEGMRCIIEPYSLPATTSNLVGGRSFSGSISVNKIRMIGPITYLVDVCGIQGATGGQPNNIASISCISSVNVDQIISITTFTNPRPNLFSMTGTAIVRDSIETGPNEETFITVDVNFEFPEFYMPDTLDLSTDSHTITLNEIANIYGSVLDKNGEPVPGVSIDLTVDPQIGHINNIAVTDHKGEFVASFTPNSIGTASIRAAIQGTELIKTQTITITQRVR